MKLTTLNLNIENHNSNKQITTVSGSNQPFKLTTVTSSSTISQQIQNNQDKLKSALSVSFYNKNSANKGEISDGVLSNDCSSTTTSTIENTAVVPVATPPPPAPPIINQPYKLGMESNYRLYENYYSTNPMTMNKHQHNQERDRKNILSRRFNLASEFHWKNSVYTSLDMLSKTLSATIISIENAIPIPFMHHLWPKYREKWLHQVSNAKCTLDLAKCMLQLEASMKPVLFVHAWRDGLGYLKLNKETLQEREERKKEEAQGKRRFGADFSYYDTTVTGKMAHFTKGIKHQVFKQKGEEYRLTGTGGWFWLHKSRRTVANRRKSQIDESKNNPQLITSGSKDRENDNELKTKTKELLLNNLKDKSSIENMLVEEANIQDPNQPWFNNSLHPHLQTFNIDVIDIVDSLKTRNLYPKKLNNENKSKKILYLESLLEKREKLNDVIKAKRESDLKNLENKLIEIEVSEEVEREKAREKEENKAVDSINVDSETDQLLNDINDIIKNQQQQQQQTSASATATSNTPSLNGNSNKTTQSQINVENIRKTIKEKFNFDEKLANLISKAKITAYGEYAIELNENIVDKTKTSIIHIPIISDTNTCYRFKITNKLLKQITSADQLQLKSTHLDYNTKLPPFQNFCVNGKHTIFVFTREWTRLIARKGGFKIEVPGYKHDNHKPSPYWPYPCSRPIVRLSWCFKTFTSQNCSALALQLRYLWTCIRWDAIGERPPVNSLTYQGGTECVLTEHFDDYIQTTELIKKRNVGLYNLRSEYLLRKKKLPYNKSKSNKLNNKFNSPNTSNGSTPRRSGLRQLRQSIGPTDTSDTDASLAANGGEIKTKQFVEEWVAEEKLHLWQIRSFYDRTKRLEIEALRAKERLIKQQQLQQQQSSISSTITQVISNQQQKYQFNNKIINNQPYKINTIQGTPLSPSPTQLQTPLRATPSSALSSTKPILITRIMPPTSTTTQIGTPVRSPLNIPTGTSKLVRLANGQYVQYNATSPALKLITTPPPTTTSRPTIVLSTAGNVQMTPPSTKIIQKGTFTPLNKQQIIIQKPTPTPIPTSSATIQVPVTGKTPQTNVTPLKASITPPKKVETVTSQPSPSKKEQKTPQKTPESVKKPQQKTPDSAKAAKQEQQPQPQSQQQQQQSSPEQETTGTRSRRQIKLPEKFNDSIGLPYDTTRLNYGEAGKIKMRSRSKSTNTSSILNTTTTTTSPGSSKTTTTTTTNNISNTTVNTTIDENNVFDVEQRRKEILDDFDNRNKQKRLDLLNKHRDNLKQVIKHKRNVLQRDIEESIRLDIDLEQYLELKKILSPQELAAATTADIKSKSENAAELTSLVNSVNKTNEKESGDNKTTKDSNDTMETKTEKPQQHPQQQQQQQIVKEDTTNKTKMNSKIDKNNENINKSEYILPAKRRSKLRQSATSPLSACKENVESIEQQTQQQQQQQPQQLQQEQQQQQQQQTQVNKSEQKQESKTEKNEKQDEDKEPIKPIKLKIEHDNESGNNKKKLRASISDTKPPQENLKPLEIKTENQVNTRKRKLTNTNQEIEKTFTTIASPVNKKSKSNNDEKVNNLNNGKHHHHHHHHYHHNKQNEKYYCICKTPYNDKLFYIQCDTCSMWYHGDCVNISEQMATKMNEYICQECEKELNNNNNNNVTTQQQQQKSSNQNKKQHRKSSDEQQQQQQPQVTNEQETNESKRRTTTRKKRLTTEDENDTTNSKNLFCLCKKPYDERVFYIGCDTCNDWFHGSCVGILPSEAYPLKKYLCPNCLKKEKKEWVLERKVTQKNYDFMQQTVQQLKNHRMAWPFLEPVDANEVPNYYIVIKEPIDFSTIESRLNSSKYKTYIEFIHDIAKMLENCRLFNPINSSFCKCADAIERLFLDKLKILKKQI